MVPPAGCSSATCLGLGYECGSGYANGTCAGSLDCDVPGCGLQATCASGTCVCDSGWGDCNNDNSCDCDLSSSSCVGGSCVVQTGYICGDDVTDPGEACDGTDLNGYNCGTVVAGFVSGTLNCNLDCKSYVTSSCVQGNTINAYSCTYVDVYSAIASASDGDIVVVPAGSCYWSSTLTIDKGIVLRGAGAGVTNIISNIVPTNPGNTYDPGNFLIIYEVVPSLDKSFRLEGFTLDMNDQSSGIMLKNTDINKVVIRINDNIIKNANMAGGSARAVMMAGTVYGVIDHNDFSGNRKNLDSYGLQGNSWDNLIFTYSSIDNIYYEDNVFSGTTLTHAGGSGGRYAARYNTYTTFSSLFPWFDAHGNQPSGVYSIMGVEIYGNQFQGDYNVRIFDHRGGKALIFNNAAESAGGDLAQVREEFDDAISPTTNPQPQHVDWHGWS